MEAGTVISPDPSPGEFGDTCLNEEKQCAPADPCPSEEKHHASADPCVSDEKPCASADPSLSDGKQTVLDATSIGDPHAAGDAPCLGEEKHHAFADSCVGDEKQCASADPNLGEGKQTLLDAASVGDPHGAGEATFEMSTTMSTTELADAASFEQSSNALPTPQLREGSFPPPSDQQQPEEATMLQPTEPAGDADSLPAGAALIAVAGLPTATIARTKVASRPRSLSRPRVANLGGASTEITVLATTEGGAWQDPVGAHNEAEAHGAGGHNEVMSGNKSPLASHGMPKSDIEEADLAAKEPVLLQDFQGSTSPVAELGVGDMDLKAPNLLQEPQSCILHDGLELGKEVEKGQLEIKEADEVEEKLSPAKLNTPTANKADYDNSPKFVVPACEQADGTVGQSPRLPSMSVPGDATWETGMDDILVESGDPLLQNERAILEADRAMYAASKGRPVVAKPWECGLQRRLLRMAFGSHEVDAKLLLKQYDLNKNGLLELEEFRSLLSDYNDGQPMKDEDLGFVMQVSDFNRDDGISVEELMHALKVWFAFQHMPASVGAALTRYGIGEGPPPSLHALGELLTTLNDSLPVPAEDSLHVLAAITRLRGAEPVVTPEKVRMAIATWYLHLERGQTPPLQFAAAIHHFSAREVMNGARAAHDLVNVSEDHHVYMGTSWSNLSQRDTPRLAIAILIFAIAMLLACLELWVGSGGALKNADAQVDDPQCEAHLRGLLYWTGLFLLLAALSNLAAVAGYAFRGPLLNAREGLANWVKTFLYIVVAMNIVYLSLHAVGFCVVTLSSPHDCGMALWEMCHFIYVVLPILLLATICCAPCCYYACVGARHGVDRHQADQALLAEQP